MGCLGRVEELTGLVEMPRASGGMPGTSWGACRASGGHVGWPGGMAGDPRRCRRGSAPLRSLQVPVPPALLPVLPPMTLPPAVLPTPVLPVLLLPVPVALAAGGRRCAALRGGRPVPVPVPAPIPVPARPVGSARPSRGERGYRGRAAPPAPGRNVPARPDNVIYIAVQGGSAPPAPLPHRPRRRRRRSPARRPAQVRPRGTGMRRSGEHGRDRGTSGRRRSPGTRGRGAPAGAARPGDSGWGGAAPNTGRGAGGETVGTEESLVAGVKSPPGSLNPLSALRRGVCCHPASLGAALGKDGAGEWR